jgi:hypothetical protein
MDQERGKAITRVLAAVLGKLVATNDTQQEHNNNSNDQQHNNSDTGVTKFHALRAPSISIQDYLDRIFKYASCSCECFVLALIYIDRVIQRQNFVINSLNIHRIIITSVMLSAKFFDDHYFKNAFYAKVGGVPCAEMNSLEVEFLFLINFSLHVSPDNYSRYYNELCNHARTMSDMIVPPPLPSPTPHGNVLHAPIPQNKEIISNKNGNNIEKVGNNSNNDNAMDVDGDGSSSHQSQPIVRATA